jgi:drug/metabolite transporter (DMT)-like permease
VVLLLVSVVRGRRLPSTRQWLAALVVGSLLLAGGAGASAYAMQTIESGLAASFIAFEPALMLIMCMAFGQRPNYKESGGVLLGLIGVTILMRGGGFSSSTVGLIAIIIGTVSWSLGSVLAIYVFRPAPGLMGAACQMICGGLVLLALSPLGHEVFNWHPDTNSLLAWLYLVVFGSVLAFSAFSYLLNHTRTPVAMSYTYVNPLVALLLGSIWGAERFSWLEILATGIIISGVSLLMQRTPVPSQKSG